MTKILGIFSFQHQRQLIQHHGPATFAGPAPAPIVEKKESEEVPIWRDQCLKM